MSLEVFSVSLKVFMVICCSAIVGLSGYVSYLAFCVDRPLHAGIYGVSAISAAVVIAMVMSL